jgi:hypothetical protein
MVQSGAVQRRSSTAPHASEAHHLHSGPHGADFLRALITGFRGPNANQAAPEELAVEPAAVEQQAPVEEEEETTPPTLPSVDEDMPMEMPTELPLEPEPEEPARAKVSQLLMSGDVFALFCGGCCLLQRKLHHRVGGRGSVAAAQRLGPQPSSSTGAAVRMHQRCPGRRRCRTRRCWRSAAHAAGGRAGGCRRHDLRAARVAVVAGTGRRCDDTHHARAAALRRPGCPAQRLASADECHHR